MQRINFLLWPWLLLLSACVTVDGPSPDEKASQINVQLGIGYYQQGNLELAKEKLVKALAQDPNSSQAHLAYAVLQNRFLDREKAEFHFRQAIELDPKNAEALNTLGAFLCNDGRYQESVKLFMRAVKVPSYRTPELAFTSAGVCLLELDSSETEQAKEYFTKALAMRTNFPPALLNLADISFTEENHELAGLYLERLHLVSTPSARSLWLNIRNEIELNRRDKIDQLADQLRTNYPDSEEYQAWLALDK
ncbi:MAG: type IV pilus biogenesis/stability protein PilW [Gammaproteobacteria bacterium]|nr:type IV pilus biogenesis/stability protein PilW [Gammaproteobacteria bacterium]